MMLKYFKHILIDNLLEDLTYNLTSTYKNWKQIEYNLLNDVYLSNDYIHFHNMHYFYKWKYEDLYDKYTMSFKEYCKINSLFKLLFLGFYIIDYFCRYRFISKEIRKLNLYLVIKYDN